MNKRRPHLRVLTFDGTQHDAEFDPLHHLVHRLHLHVVHAFGWCGDVRTRDVIRAQGH